MSEGLLAAVACATGAAVLVLELMAVRLMAPWFGQSQLVWTNVIGVVLASLALGQWLGGRWAARGTRGPAGLLLGAGALGVVVPDLVGFLGPRLVPDDLPLLEAHPFVVYGSLLVSMLALGPGLVAAGAVAPWLVALSRDASAAPGRAAGRVLAAGTLGSLAGTFGSTHLLLGWLGSAGAVRTAGVVLVLAGLVLKAPARARVGAALLIGAGLLLPGAEPPADLLASVETPYQMARVVEHDDGTRLLVLNEGLDSFHSVWTPQGLWTDRYYDAFLVPGLMAPPGDDEVRGVLVVGLAAGTMARQLLAADPGLEVTGVEIDPALIDLGRRWFDLPDAVQVVLADGRVVLEGRGPRYGAILMDAYADQIYLPAHLSTVECFEAARRRLLPGGVIALNVGGVLPDDPVVAALTSTLAAAFDDVTLARVPGQRNWIVLGWNGADPGLAARRAVVEGLGGQAPERLGWMLDPERFLPADAVRGQVLRDGAAPVESLAHGSWERAARPGAGGDGAQASSTAVTVSPAELAADPVERVHLARRRLAAGRVPEAEVLLAGLEELPPLLAAEVSLLWGNANFERARWAAARAHYDRALAAYEAAADVDPAAAARGQAAARDNLAFLDRDAGRRAVLEERARGLARGALGVGLAGLVLGLVLARRAS